MGNHETIGHSETLKLRMNLDSALTNILYNAPKVLSEPILRRFEDKIVNQKIKY